MAKIAPTRGGQALKRYIHMSRAKAGISSDMALARMAGVHYDTLMNWYADSTRPRGAELQKVATALDVPYVVLDAVYEGRDPEPPPLQDAVADLTSAVRDLVDEMRRDRRAGASGPMSVNMTLQRASETELGVREGDERDRTRRGLEDPSKPVPLRPRRPPDSGAG